MKIRNGFVSNSSSSSFIIDINNSVFKTIKEVAKYMLFKMEDPDDPYTNSNTNEYDKILNKLGDNDPVCFPSINYDTYITKIEDNILIATCNNTDWELWDENGSLSESVKKKLQEIEKEDIEYDEECSIDYDSVYVEDMYYVFNRIGYFNSLRFEGLFGKKANDDDGWSLYCKKNSDKNCHTYTTMWETEFGNICPYCDKAKYQRLLKLKNIINL